jgi:hypothetical protein
MAALGGVAPSSSSSGGGSNANVDAIPTVKSLANGLAPLAATMLDDSLGFASVKIEHAAGPREGLRPISAPLIAS